MKRIRHTVVDQHKFVRASKVLPEGETFEPPEWVRRKIEIEGWAVVAVEFGESGLNDHGHADWKVVADQLAISLRQVYENPDNDEGVEQALDAYDIAVAEVALAIPFEEFKEPDDD